MTLAERARQLTLERELAPLSRRHEHRRRREHPHAYDSSDINEYDEYLNFEKGESKASLTLKIQKKFKLSPKSSGKLARKLIAVWAKEHPTEPLGQIEHWKNGQDWYIERDAKGKFVARAQAGSVKTAKQLIQVPLAYRPTGRRLVNVDSKGNITVPKYVKVSADYKQRLITHERTFIEKRRFGATVEEAENAAKEAEHAGMSPQEVAIYEGTVGFYARRKETKK